MFNIVSAKLTSLPSSRGWSQIYEFSPSDQNILTRRGQIYVVIATDHSENNIDMITSARSFFSRLHDEYFGTEIGRPFFVLKSAVETVADEFRQIWGSVEINAVVIQHNIVYSVSSGGGGIFVMRNGVLAKILTGQENRLTSVSGYINKDDTIFIGTKSLFDKIPETSIKKALVAPTPTAGIEILTEEKNEAGDDTGSMGGMILNFKSDEDVFFQKNKTTIVEIPEYDLKVKQKLHFNINFLTKLFSLRLPRKSIYVKSPLTDEVSPQSKKLTFFVALVLLVLLTASIGFGIRQKKINDVKNKYQSILTQAENEIDQAISLASINVDRSRQLFADAQEKIAQMDESNVKDKSLTELKQKMNESRAAILGEYLVKPDMFLDLTLLSSGFKGDTISFSGGQIYVLDKAGGRVISVNVSTKKSKVVAGPSVINSGSALACYEEKVFVLENDGIYEVDSRNSKVVNKTWSGEALIAAFAGNIYVMDKAGGAIYRYPGINNTFGEKQNWLSAGTNANFENVSQITIDGSIYALFPNSKIVKFSKGSPLNFNLKGVIPEIGNIDAIAASPDNDFIYLLDRAGKRVVVTDKKGIYRAQYVDQGISQAVNLVVSEADKKIILLTGDKLYSVEIKN